MRGLPVSIRERIRIGGRIDHSTLIARFQRSQILFMPSRWEGFPNAASEAVCCGCSVVGAAELSSLVYFASRSSGTLAPFRTYNHFLDALDSEMCEWEKGRRDPAKISTAFLPDLSLSRVIQLTLSFFK